MITLAALVCFAANSLLCRYALGGSPGMIDAATFTTVRLAAGAVTLGVHAPARTSRRRAGDRPFRVRVFFFVRL